jgi:hypothetical protein
MEPFTPTLVQQRIRAHSVFVYQLGSGGFGSGVLVELQNRIFVLSAAHVIEGDVDVNLGIIPHESRFKIIDKWINKDTDTGFLELSASEVNLRLSQFSAPFPVGGIKAHTFKSRSTTLALCGFPAGESIQTERGREVHLFYLAVGVIAPEQWPADIAGRYDPNKTFLVSYGPRWGNSFVDGNKVDRAPVSPFGMSGCGLWYYDRDNQNAEPPWYALGGIQHSYSEREQVLLGTLVDELIREVARHCGIVL